ncbi:hypothetical protein [Mycobacterium sp.]|uniref:hypothetical protein n=1 Tax=Mycobacterium sp. TaxID=1785 RepID=UPI002BEC8B60|nr:hypothetical protein [Mycobacterium sp.]HME50423.1 hypothetical protein [Mycobacterium sp.]
MTHSAQTPTQVRRIALAAMMALAGASSLVLLNEIHVGPAWVQWVVSLVALAAALGVLVIADLSWQRAVANAEADGLVAGHATDAPDA